ncbi:MAG: hypothetical protein M2R45_03455 [Verrucomicrobia subdivision 3 bacterium]|nr:hypothetical protein [Limisphaerales bacterium]MCS1415728.1 hypothetical protein [Limisphaerales bacterium]
MKTTNFLQRNKARFAGFLAVMLLGLFFGATTNLMAHPNNTHIWETNEGPQLVLAPDTTPPPPQCVNVSGLYYGAMGTWSSDFRIFWCYKSWWHFDWDWDYFPGTRLKFYYPLLDSWHSHLTWEKCGPYTNFLEELREIEEGYKASRIVANLAWASCAEAVTSSYMDCWRTCAIRSALPTFDLSCFDDCASKRQRD